MNKFRLGLTSSGFQNLTEQDFKNCAKSGINTVEISLHPSRYDELEWKQVKSRADMFDVELWSLHLPFEPFDKLDPSAVDDDIRSYTKDYFSELIKKGGDIGIKTIVVHPSIEPNLESERAEKIKCAKDSFSYLAEVAEKAGCVIAIENLPRTCLGRDSSDMLELLSADSRLRSCFDTNHLLEESSVDYIKAVGSKIITTHVSDYDFKNERHWLPGEGKIDWVTLINTLKEVGYSGPWLYELNLEPSFTIDRRNLTTDDFKNNYIKLMELEFPKPIGTPIDEKCIHWKDL